MTLPCTDMGTLCLMATGLAGSFLWYMVLFSFLLNQIPLAIVELALEKIEEKEGTNHY